MDMVVGRAFAIGAVIYEEYQISIWGMVVFNYICGVMEIVIVSIPHMGNGSKKMLDGIEIDSCINPPYGEW